MTVTCLVSLLVKKNLQGPRWCPLLFQRLLLLKATAQRPPGLASKKLSDSVNPNNHNNDHNGSLEIWLTSHINIIQELNCSTL